MKRWIAVAAAAAAVGLVGACGGTGDADAPAAGGTSTPPARIVPLNGNVAEIVYALGLGDEVVGVDDSALYPAEAAAKQPKIGYQRSLNAEGILSLRPTIVIGTDEAGPPDVIDQVRAAGARVEILPAPTSLDDVPARIRSIADLLGVPAKGVELADRVTNEISDAKASVPAGAAKPRVAFLYLRGPGTQMLGGIGSKADAMITGAGAVDAGTEAGVQGFKPITPEALAAAKPEVILVLTAGLRSVGGADGVLGIPGVAQTPAGAAKRIVDLEDTYLLNMGPRTGAALKDLIAKVHG